MSRLEMLLGRPRVYRLWQAPFAQKKLDPLLLHNDLTRARRILDVGCGPGTNAALFKGADYVGLDWNDSYVRYARQHHSGRFVTADVRCFTLEDGARFDCILVNSMLHHLSDGDVRQVLDSLAALLTKDGMIHILELVLPSRMGAARILASLDRGRFARPLANWRALFNGPFAPQIFEPYSVASLGLRLWEMVYFRGGHIS